VPGPALGSGFTQRNSTTHFVVYYETTLGINGQNLADAVLGTCEADYQKLQGWFGNINIGSLPFHVRIRAGSNGASHASCTSTDIYCDAFNGTDSDLARSLLVAEADEVFMANQGKGWDCGGSNGEALSRVLAAEIYPNELTPPGLGVSFASAASWLDGGRPDWVNRTEGTDGDFVSIGCGTLFINWLRFQLGFNLNAIVQAGGSTLAETYHRVTGRAADGALPRFLKHIAARFPLGVPSGLANDNPFPYPVPVPHFQGSPSVFPTNAGANKKSIYVVTTDGRLLQAWDSDYWDTDFPAEAAGQGALRFQGSSAVFPTNAGANKKSVYILTTDGRLAQVWDTNRWNLDFPAELAGQGALRFVGKPAVFATNAGANKKSIYLVTTDGRLAQIWDTDRWNLDFPAELSGNGGLRFEGSPAVFPTDAAANKKSIYVVTRDGRLAQLWDTDHWNLDFPAEAAGHADLRFQGAVAVFPTNAGANKKSIYLLTTDGRLAQLWDSNRWNLDFPAELAGQSALRFRGAAAVFPTNAGANKKSIYLVTTDGRLAQIWDTDRWNLDFPAELAGQNAMRFHDSPAVFPTNAGANKKSIYLVTTDGRLAQVWDTDRWNLDFPVELAY
jgi:predicted nucleic acid-binding protein